MRAAIQQYTTEELTYNYFSQNLLIQFWQEKGRNPLIYNDPRGVLYAPHSEDVLQFGTFEVDQYIFPEHEYNKILYLEKKGLWHTIKASGLHKKYDMAVIAGEGYASEAVRVLLEKAQAGQDYTIFVLHDADPDGYNIARTISEKTKRMPDHNIEVIDLGLTVHDAIEMELSSETFTRKKELASDLKLNAIELDYFRGELKETGTKKNWVCKRIELNAMSAGQLVAYIDAGISRAIGERNLEKKVVPPEAVLSDTAGRLFEHNLGKKVDQYITELLQVDKLKSSLLASVGGFDDREFNQEVTGYLVNNELKTWGHSMQVIVDGKMNELNETIQTSIKELVTSAIKAA